MTRAEECYNSIAAGDKWLAVSSSVDANARSVAHRGKRKWTSHFFLEQASNPAGRESLLIES